MMSVLVVLSNFMRNLFTAKSKDYYFSIRHFTGFSRYNSIGVL